MLKSDRQALAAAAQYVRTWADGKVSCTARILHLQVVSGMNTSLVRRGNEGQAKSVSSGSYHNTRSPPPPPFALGWKNPTEPWIAKDMLVNEAETVLVISRQPGIQVS